MKERSEQKLQRAHILMGYTTENEKGADPHYNELKAAVPSTDESHCLSSKPAPGKFRHCSPSKPLRYSFIFLMSDKRIERITIIMST